MSDMQDLSRCPLCGSTNVTSHGRIFHPKSPHVARVPISLPSKTYNLLKCNVCGFSYKDPAIPEPLLLNCYALAAKATWGETVNGLQRRYDVLSEVLHKCTKGKRILDVGCFTGTFLESLGPDWTRYGVEPSTDAADVARKRGISIIGKTLADIPTNVTPFDAILAIDVVEHLAEPASFFSLIAGLLKPNGIILILTADTDAITWLFHKSRHWYCSLPEHVSFYNPRCLSYIAERFGLRPILHKRIRHHRLQLPAYLIQLLKNWCFYLATTVNRYGFPVPRSLAERHAPGLIMANDHMIYVARKYQS